MTAAVDPFASLTALHAARPSSTTRYRARKLAAQLGCEAPAWALQPPPRPQPPPQPRAPRLGSPGSSVAEVAAMRQRIEADDDAQWAAAAARDAASRRALRQTARKMQQRDPA